MPDADVIVLGVGTCGEDLSLRLMAAGLDVVGIDARLVGGECPYFACLPTKSLVRSANLVQEARRANGLVGQVEVVTDWSVVAGRIRSEITGGWVDDTAVARFEAKGGRFVRGRGRLTGPDSVSVGGVEYRAKRGIVIATGSRPFVPPIPGLADIEYWTTRDAVQAERLPRSLLVLGGGAVGCELGQVFSRFGVDVAIVEGAGRLLPAEEPEASAVLSEVFAAEGIAVHTGAKVESVRPRAGSTIATLDTGEEIASERILVATGRQVDLDDLGLEAARIAAGGRYISVDERMRAAPGIWAIGDVTGVGMLTSVAMYQGSVCVADILGRSVPAADYSVIPRATFTDPEIGAVGMTEAQAREAGIDVAVAVKHLGSTFRGWLHRTGNDGVVKLVVDRVSGRLVGATSMGPHGAEVLGMPAVMMKTGVPVTELLDLIYAFPTFHGGIGEALGAYGRGVGRVLDPETEPMFGD